MGVIDKHGQWETCNHCGKMVNIRNLFYGWSTRWDQNVDLCHSCSRLGMKPPTVADVGNYGAMRVQGGLVTVG